MISLSSALLASTMAVSTLLPGFFSEWKTVQSAAFEAAKEPQKPIDANKLFDEKALEKANQRLKIRDLTSAITREFFLKNFRKGEALLTELKALNPTNGIDLYFQSILEFEKGNFATSIFMLEECLKKNNELDPAWNMLGYLYSRSGDQERALKAFEKAIAFEPYHPVYRYNHARALWLTGSFSAALDETKRVLDLRDNMPEAYFLAGLILEDMKREKEALPYYRLAEERGLSEDDFYVHYFRLGLKLDSSADLLRLLEKTRQSKNPDLIRMQATIRMNAGEFQRALEFNLQLLSNGHYVEEDLARTGELLCRTGTGMSGLQGTKLNDAAISRIRVGFEKCEGTRRKGPDVRDPVLQPAL
ncbi:tetratricopeptide repeat protein [Leptonema illini]|uniref:Tetratricopeptide TPR_1 repeat-containing protein n=1 Tax=Leptonema illini DSM 21528 TaxID=929563 RepID=H2CI50_9LEPT|nr:tetratricopeptide repeat protein [Leptonema illini]EHQ08073.1 Tetratricopeptide TPR_1 repeat-containing protein [Leptonema illini DSM 21528]